MDCVQLRLVDRTGKEMKVVKEKKAKQNDLEMMGKTRRPLILSRDHTVLTGFN